MSATSYFHHLQVHELTLANGTMAKKLKLKRKAASQFDWCATIERGTKTSRMLTQEPKKNHL